MTIANLGPLDWRIPIVTEEGRPTQEFQRRWAAQIGNNSQIGSITIGAGPPAASPAPADGAQYADTSTTPYTLYIGGGGVWNLAGSSGANPTATAGDVAINGSANTYMRSDAAPAVQKASSSQFGIVKVDGTTITESGGVISSAGSGGGIGFRDAINTGGAASGSAFASKGNIILLNSNIRLLGITQNITTSANYSLFVVACNGSNVITSVLGSTTPMAVTATSVTNFKLSTPLNIASGTRVGLIITRTGGAATDPCGLSYPTSPGSGGWGFTWVGSVRYASASPTIGDSILFNTTDSPASTVTYGI